MTINKLYLQIDEGSKAYSHNSEFAFETNFITEYLSKSIFKRRYKYKNANKLIVYIDAPKTAVEYTNVFKTLECSITAHYSEISEFEDAERTEKILNIIEKAAIYYEKYLPDISQVIHESNQSFRKSRYKNVWLSHKKKIDQIGTAKLICELTRDNFTLDFVVENRAGEIFRKEILKEMPDSLCYHHKFKNIQIEDKDIHVLDRNGKSIFRISTTELLRDSEK